MSTSATESLTIADSNPSISLSHGGSVVPSSEPSPAPSTAAQTDTQPQEQKANAQQPDDDLIMLDSPSQPKSTLQVAKEAFDELLKNLSLGSQGNVDEEIRMLRQFGIFVKDSLLNHPRSELFQDLFESDDAQPEGRSSRASRVLGHSMVKKYLATKRNRAELVHDLLTSSESLLCSVPLGNIVNACTFNTMVPAVTKDSLISLLPECDTDSHESVTELFNKPEFVHSLRLFQRHLHAGTFDTSDTRRRKQREMHPWKLDHFEHIWGMRLLSDVLVEPPPPTQPSFTYTDPKIAELAIFTEPMPIAEVGQVSIQEVRESLIHRDTSSVSSFLFPGMEHWHRRRQMMHRNPEAELYVRCANITTRRAETPDYAHAQWQGPQLLKWEKELTKIRKLKEGPGPTDPADPSAEKSPDSDDDQTRSAPPQPAPTPLPTPASAPSPQAPPPKSEPPSTASEASAPPPVPSTISHASVTVVPPQPVSVPEPMKADTVHDPVPSVTAAPAPLPPSVPVFNSQPKAEPLPPAVIATTTTTTVATTHTAPPSESTLTSDESLARAVSMMDDFADDYDEPDEFVPSPAEVEEEYVPDQKKERKNTATARPRKKRAAAPRKEKSSFRSVAYEVLKREERPLPPKEIVSIALRDQLFSTSGKTPENTLAAVLYKDIQKNKDLDTPSVFVRLSLKPVSFALREWGLQADDE